MSDRETNLANAFETTLTASMGPTALTATVATTSGGPASPALLVIDPDDPAKREVVYFNGTFTGTTFTMTTVASRYQAGSAAGSGITHDVGAVVRSAPLAQHIEDLNDRVDKHTHAGGTTGMVLTTSIDHGAISGLSDDDHAHYLNRARHKSQHLTQSNDGPSGTVTVNSGSAPQPVGEVFNVTTVNPNAVALVWGVANTVYVTAQDSSDFGYLYVDLDGAEVSSGGALAFFSLKKQDPDRARAVALAVAVSIPTAGAHTLQLKASKSGGGGGEYTVDRHHSQMMVHVVDSGA